MGARIACLRLLAYCSSCFFLAAQLFTPSGIAQSDASDAQKEDENRKFIQKFVDSFSQPVRIQESEPVTVNDVQFSLAAQTNWQPPIHDYALPRVAAIDIQLSITNLSRKELVFPTANAFGVRMITANGKEVKASSKGGPATARAALSIPPGVSYALCRRAELHRGEKPNSYQLVYHDARGLQSVIGPLEPGRYQLACWYSVPAEKQEVPNGSNPVWIGNALTKEVSIELHGDTIRGIVPGVSKMALSPDTLRIRASKPITVNDAQFVVVSQADWRLGKTLEDVPLEIHLRVTNVGKKDLLFPLFDTFGVKLSTLDGKKVAGNGGRSVTILPRPILLSPGASYTLGAEGVCELTRRLGYLHWHAQTKETQLIYHDGTGWMRHFRALEPGRYRLAFWYAASPEGPFSTARHSATWMGAAVTEELIVEVQNP